MYKFFSFLFRHSTKEALALGGGAIVSIILSGYLQSMICFYTGLCLLAMFFIYALVHLLLDGHDKKWYKE